jgi:uncharacterized RDD family membrane protein YckC
MNSNASFDVSESSAPAEALSSERATASPWRRFLAYLTDSFVLGLIGFGAGSVFSQRFSELGLWGRLVGVCVAVAYFSFFDSGLADGQTPGKRWLNIRVVDLYGETISLGKAVVRSIVFAAPCFLFGLDLPVTRTPWAVSALLTAIVYGVGGSTIYLVAFEKNARQGSHDLAAGSYVVNAEDTGPVGARHIGAIHWGILGSLILVFSVAAVVVQRRMDESVLFRQMNGDARVIEGLPGVQRARVRDLLLHNAGDAGASKVLRVSLIRSGSVPNQEILAGQTARLLLQNDRSARGYDEISILVFNGYDIGIATHWNHREFVHTPGEWSQSILGSASAGVPTSARQ